MKEFGAVITGDVIASRKSSPERWMPHLKSVLKQFGGSPETWDIYRGDAFQLLLPEAPMAFNAAMKIKAGFKLHKGLDLRMAIGVGNVNYQAKRVGESSGSAFIRAGELIDTLERLHTTIAMASSWPDLDQELNASLAMAAALMDKWMPSYAEVMVAYLDEPHQTQQSLANQLGIAQNTLSERQSKARRRELFQFDTVFQRKLTRVIQNACV